MLLVAPGWEQQWGGQPRSLLGSWGLHWCTPELGDQKVPQGPLFLQSSSARSSHHLSGCDLSCVTWKERALGALCRAGGSGCKEFVSSAGVTSMASLWRSADLGRLHTLALGGHSVSSSVLETTSPSMDMRTYGARSHHLQPAKLWNCYLQVQSERLGISADLTLTQLSLSILIVSAAGAVRCTGLWVWEVECWGFLFPVYVIACKWFYGFKITLNLLLRQPAFLESIQIEP